MVGDVTRLGDLRPGAAFDLVYDNKCFHGLRVASRPAYASGVAEACGPGGTFLLFALAAGRGRRLMGLPAGVEAGGVGELFQAAFEMQRSHAGGSGLFSPDFYEMVRRRGSC